jgi:arginine decarboxylase
MLVPYPPGIPMSMPGERLGGPDSPVIRLILAMEKFGKQFPGFERETHGIEIDEHGEYWMRAVIETANAKKNGRGKQHPPSSAPPVKRKKKLLPGDAEPPVPGTTKIAPER